MNDTPWKRRRRLLTHMLWGTAMLPVTGFAQCLFTPEQTEGPFYPPQWPDQPSMDLTHGGRAKGQMIVVQGRVTDNQCRPVSGAVVELWQANHWGRYHHPRDRFNQSPLDPHFTGQGRVKTGDDGRYEFITIKPAGYPVNRDWKRPPHLHFKVIAGEHDELTTQMYFAGEALNGEDRILHSLTPEEQKRVVVVLNKNDDGWRGRFDFHFP